MRIAVTYDNGMIFQHFGQTERFQVYDVEQGEIKMVTTINTNGSGHGALADILKKCGVDILICGGIGAGAKRGLAEAGITLYGGVTGSADKAVADFLAEKLVYNSDVQCNHHREHHEHHGGTCGGQDGTCGH